MASIKSPTEKKKSEDQLYFSKIETIKENGKEIKDQLESYSRHAVLLSPCFRISFVCFARLFGLILPVGSRRLIKATIPIFFLNCHLLFSSQFPKHYFPSIYTSILSSYDPKVTYNL
jgi:hypothetical protein